MPSPEWVGRTQSIEDRIGRQAECEGAPHAAGFELGNAFRLELKHHRHSWVYSVPTADLETSQPP